jgi:hypothetical protein
LSATSILLYAGFVAHAAKPVPPPPSGISLSVSSFDFGSVTVGSHSEASLWIENSSAFDLVVTILAEEDGTYVNFSGSTAVSHTYSLPSGWLGYQTFIFEPQLPGRKKGVIRIRSVSGTTNYQDIEIPLTAMVSPVIGR